MSWGSMTGERRAGLRLLSYVRKSWRAREQGLDEGTASAGVCPDGEEACGAVMGALGRKGQEGLGCLQPDPGL